MNKPLESSGWNKSFLKLFAKVVTSMQHLNIQISVHSQQLKLGIHFVVDSPKAMQFTVDLVWFQM